jgi:hypothetical protein
MLDQSRRNLMKNRLVRFMVRLVLTSFVLGGGILSALAHDLPNFTATEGNVVDCLGSESCPYLAPIRPQGSQRSSLLVATPSSAISLAMAYSQIALESRNFGGQFTSRLHVLAKLWSHGDAAADPIQLAAFPDVGAPPAPVMEKLIASSPEQNWAGRSIAKRRFVEDYMPYDFCVRDWRFGQYSYRGLSRIAHLDLGTAEITDESQLALAIISEPTPPSAVAVGLSNFLDQLADIQCRLYGEFNQLQVVRNFASKTAAVYLNANARFPSRADRVIEPAKTIEQQPYFTQPLYIVYEHGAKQFLLTIEQAQQWRTATDLARSVRDENTVVTAPANTTARESMSKKLVGMAQSQLQRLQHEFLRLWSQLDRKATVGNEPSVASLEQTEVR